MKLETSATEADDARLVVFPEQDHALSAASAFNALEDGRISLQEGSIAKSYCLNVAEPVKDSAPVAPVGMDYFRFMAEAAVDQGHLSPEGLQHVMAALERDAR